MKIIFLDIDGVLNNLTALESGTCNMGIGLWTGDTTKKGSGFDAQCVNQLKRILAATNANIVISSTWRKLNTIDVLREVFANWGIDPKRIIGDTPITDRGHRGQEIKSWIDMFTKDGATITKWIAIDDDSDFHSDQILIQTSFETGLTPEVADLAIEALM